MSSSSTKPSPLGRGLSALLGDVDASYQPADKGPQRQGVPGLTRMPTSWLRSGKYQPRQHFNEEALRDLSNSIKERGILEPLLVRPLPGAKDSYEIVAGERRWRAAQMASLHDVPVMVRELSDREAMEFGIIENVQREDLSPIEEGEGYKRLIEEFGHTQEKLGQIVGKSRPHITNMLRLLTLPRPVQDMIEDGRLTSGHARALVPTKEPLKLALEVIKKGLNVRQTETLAKKNQDAPEVHKKRVNPEESADVLALETELEKVIGLKVKIATKGKAGTLTLYYTDLDQLDDIIKRLRG
ncbi:MAG: ParB/RepB/Spo0J family partition protein [Alphaproteobacteria bacterium]|nr:ParB/RepB/Spo0J family partition protein [Alphaproteobacteria bacterium]